MQDILERKQLFVRISQNVLKNLMKGSNFPTQYGVECMTVRSLRKLSHKELNNLNRTTVIIDIRKHLLELFSMGS